jgi:hypothetical protein
VTGAQARRFAARLMRVCVPTLLWAFIIITAPMFASKLHQDNRAAQEDFAVYYYSALEMRHGVNPYTTDFTQMARASGLNIHGMKRGTDPPTFVTLFETLSRLPLWTAYWIWQSASLACLATALLLLLGRGSGSGASVVSDLGGCDPILSSDRLGLLVWAEQASNSAAASADNAMDGRST